VELAVGFVGTDGGADDVDDVASVHAFIHLHQGNAGFGFPVHDCSLDGGGASVFGEDGAVEVDSAAFGGFKQFCGQDLTVGSNNVDVGFQLLDLLDELRFASFFGGFDREAELLSFELDGRGFELHPSSGGAVGLCDDEYDVVSEFLERGDGEVARAEVNNFQSLILVPGVEFGVFPVEGCGVYFVDEEDSVEVVNFMLSDPGWHTLKLKNELAALSVHRFNFNVVVSFDVAVKTRDAEATFLSNLLAFGFDYFWVDEGSGSEVQGGHDEQALADPNLRRSQSDAVSFSHDPHHFVDEEVRLFCQTSHFCCNFPENWIRDFDDRALYGLDVKVLELLRYHDFHPSHFGRSTRVLVRSVRVLKEMPSLKQTELNPI
jgi:hypothetical protein